jgi:hypothetical protein
MDKKKKNQKCHEKGGEDLSWGIACGRELMW